MAGIPPRSLQPSAPIPIAPRRAAPAAAGGASRKGGAAFVSASVPNAPVFGSLKAPTVILDMPDLSLPPSSPEAFSLTAALPEAEPVPKSRMVGVSSAPARTFIDQARKGGASPGGIVPGYGVSPTVLSVLQQRGADDMLAKRPSGPSLASGGGARPAAGGAGDVFAKQPIGGGPAAQRVPHGAGVPGPEGSLAAALRTGAAAGDAGPGHRSAGGHGSSASASAATMVYGSLRDAQLRTAAGIVHAIAEETDSDEEDEAPVAASGRAGVAGGRGRGGATAADDSSDDEDGGVALGASGVRRGPGGAAVRAGRLPSDTRDEGIFESDI